MSLNQVEHDSSVWCLRLKLVKGLSAWMESKELVDVALPNVLTHSRTCVRKNQEGINPTAGRVRIGVARNLRYPWLHEAAIRVVSRMEFVAMKRWP